MSSTSLLLRVAAVALLSFASLPAPAASPAKTAATRPPGAAIASAHALATDAGSRLGDGRLDLPGHSAAIISK